MLGGRGSQAKGGMSSLSPKQISKALPLSYAPIFRFLNETSFCWFLAMKNCSSLKVKRRNKLEIGDLGVDGSVTVVQYVPSPKHKLRH